MYSFAIVTTAATGDLATIHDRMPIILENEEQILQWLSPFTLPDSEHLIEPLRGVKPSLHCMAVNHCVNSSRNNVPECRMPLEIKEDKKDISTFFKQQPIKSETTANHPLPLPIKIKTEPAKKKDITSFFSASPVKQSIKQEVKNEVKQEPVAIQNELKSEPMSPRKKVFKQQKLNFG